jgi:hypothetical protein
VIQLEHGRVTLTELAKDDGVPAQLILLEAAAHATLRGDLALLGPSLAAWCLEMQRLVRQL